MQLSATLRRVDTPPHSKTVLKEFPKRSFPSGLYAAAIQKTPPGTKIARAGVLGLGPAPSKKASALPNLLDIFPRRDGFYPQERPLKGSLVFIAGLFGHRQHIPLSRVKVLLGLLHAE